MIEYRIIAEHPDAQRPVTLYATFYANLARQEWKNTPREGSAFTGHRFQRRLPGRDWENVPDGS